jgi:hypothetical protein
MSVRFYSVTMDDKFFLLDVEIGMAPHLKILIPFLGWLCTGTNRRVLNFFYFRNDSRDLTFTNYTNVIFGHRYRNGCFKSFWTNQEFLHFNLF